MTRRQAIVCIGGYHCGLTVAVPRVPGCPLDSWPAQAQDQRGAPGRARAQRKRGWLPVADPPVTLKDVAARARVHPATASRALNPETRLLVREDTAQRVLDAAAELGYRPNTVARSLRPRRSHSVGVLIPDLNNPLFPPIIRGIEDRLAEHGYVALIGSTDVDLGKERLVFGQRRGRRADGL